MLPIGDTIPSRNPPVAVWMLILANAFVFLLELSMPEAALNEFLRRFGMVPARYSPPFLAEFLGLAEDDYWPFLTSMFLHGGWTHILGNMWTLWIFGDNVEDRMGPLRFTVFYLLCGVAANLTHLALNPQSVIPAVGASGAIAGVMGAYFFLFPQSRVIVMFPVFFLPLFFELPAVAYLGFWALSQVFSGTLALAGPQNVGGVAWWAHVGGFAAGAVLHFAFVRQRGSYRRKARDLYFMETPYLPPGHWRR